MQKVARNTRSCQQVAEQLVESPNLSRDLEIPFFRASVEYVLLYGSESWDWPQFCKNNVMAATQGFYVLP